jgi:hypothetical protein
LFKKLDYAYVIEFFNAGTATLPLFQNNSIATIAEKAKIESKLVVAKLKLMKQSKI